MENFQVYRGGAERVRKGWARKQYRNRSGGVCLVQSVLDEMSGPVWGMSGRTLPPEMISEIDRSLEHYRSYRKLRSVGLKKGRLDRQEVIECWNDIFGTQRRVAKALDRLAGEAELEFLRAEHERLTEKVARLTARVEKLEAENRGLRRMTNSYALRADRQQLENVERELAAIWKQQVTASLATK